MPEYNVVNKPLEWFKPNAENYRSHPAPQVDVLQESIRRFGVFRNVVARPDGTILAGHGILAAAQAEGLTSFPCVIFYGTDEEARALMVADNEQARLAEDDDNALAALLSSLAESDIGVTVTGWTGEEVEALLDVTDHEFMPDAGRSGDEKSLVGKWLVAIVVDEPTHRALKDKLAGWQLPGEDIKQTLQREFTAMVQSR